MGRQRHGVAGTRRGMASLRPRHPSGSDMSDPIGFLHTFAHVLGLATLYPEGHPSRERAIDAAFEALDGLPVPTAITLLEDEVVFGRERLRGLRSWDWGPRLVAAGGQRLGVGTRAER